MSEITTDERKEIVLSPEALARIDAASAESDRRMAAERDEEDWTATRVRDLEAQVAQLQQQLAAARNAALEEAAKHLRGLRRQECAFVWLLQNQAIEAAASAVEKLKT